jgi:soluble cytochrome b562
MDKEVLKEIKKVIKDIENEFEVEPTEDNEGDCLDAKEGFEILINKLKKLAK